jgi:hypothetical protein
MRRATLLITLLAFPASVAQGQSLKHIIIIVKENRSFDQYFGQFPGVTGGPITSYNCVGTEGGCTGGTLAAIPGYPNLPDANCGHYFSNSTSDYNNGLMNQFNENCSGSSDWAKQYGPTTIPTYWSHATNYGLADRMFASVMGPSYPNHLYMIAASSNEAQDNPGMAPGKAPNGTGNNTWACDAFHYGRCSTNVGILCSTNADCVGNGTCNIDLGTGHRSVTTTASCTLDSDCASSGGGYCSNGDTYTGSFYGIDIQGGTGKEMYPGACNTHRTVGCNSICTGAAHNCALTTDCNVTSPTANCNLGDPICTALSGDVCDAASKQFISAGRGSACPNVSTIADLLEPGEYQLGDLLSDWQRAHHGSTVESGGLRATPALRERFTLAVGMESITACLQGQHFIHRQHSHAVNQVVTQASTTTTLVSSQNPSNFQEAVTFTATVLPQFSGTTAGTVVFKDGTTALKTVVLSGGVAKFTTSTLASGTHQNQRDLQRRCRLHG